MPASPGAPAGRLLRGGVRGLGIAALVAFVVATASGTFFGARFLAEVRAPVLLVGALVAAPALAVLVLAARARGVAWRWLAFGVAWGLFAAAWISLTFEAALEPLTVVIGSVAAPLGSEVALAAPGAVIAPVVEEPAKLIGVLVVLIAARRAGVRLTAAVGAAVGGVVGLAFGLSEGSHRIATIVLERGFVDLDGVFRIDWELIGIITQLQLIAKLFAFGFTNHALFTAIAGVGLVTLLGGRWRASLGWFAVALLAHALLNSVGVAIGERVFPAVNGSASIAVDPAARLWAFVAAWVAAAAGFLVAEGWAAVLLVRRLRREGRAPDPATAAALVTPSPAVTAPPPIASAE
ncbi:MAG: PrsW family intramembrane metalloprotease [Chloroflexota bacterium]|nr:MAG: PrsW family intramembrane metalloprotease [Chloroflexota bacterium]